MAKTARKWRHGDPIPGVQCPTCGGGVTYNGNYYCLDFDSDDCDWALPEEEEATPAEKHLFNVAYVALMTNRDEEALARALWYKRDGSLW